VAIPAAVVAGITAVVGAVDGPVVMAAVGGLAATVAAVAMVAVVATVAVVTITALAAGVRLTLAMARPGMATTGRFLLRLMFLG
jgi:hypothetical protein